MARLKMKRGDGFTQVPLRGPSHFRTAPIFYADRPSTRRYVKVGARTVVLSPAMPSHWQDVHGWLAVVDDVAVGVVARLHRRDSRRVACWQALTRPEVAGLRRVPLGDAPEQTFSGTLYPTRREALVHLLATAAVATPHDAS